MPVSSITSRQQPQSGTLRLYVHGTSGDDAASGTSWATAWKTYAKLERELAVILSVNPTALTVIVYLRGDFSAQDLRLVGTLHGSTRVHVVHHMDDWTTVKSGTAATVAATTFAHGLCEMTFVGLVLDATDEGRALVLEDGTGKRVVYQILRVWDNAGTITATINRTSVATWIVGGIIASIREPSLEKTNPGSLNYGLDFQDPGIRSLHDNTVLGLVCKNAVVSGCSAPPGMCLWMPGAAWWTGLYVRTSWIATRVIFGGTYGLPVAVAQEFGLVGTNTDDTTVVGSRLAGQLNAVAVQNGARASIYGWCDGSLFAQMGGSLSSYSCNTTIVEAQDGLLIVGRTIIRGKTGSTFGIIASHRSEAAIATTSFLDIPAAGFSLGLLLSRRGSDMWIGTTVDGNNTGTGTGLVAVSITDHGNVQFNGAPHASLIGKHGFLKLISGKVRVAGAYTKGAMEGGGPDFYVEDGELQFAGAVTKSAPNTIASAVLRVARGGRVSQTAGSAFTIATPAADWATSYGAKGAIVADDGPVAVRLGTLTGGAAGTTGIGCTLGKGARLVHAGAGLLGAAPLKMGAAAPIAWPAVPTTDDTANTTTGVISGEGCKVIPNVA